MNKNNAKQWQEVISKPQSNKQLKKPAFVKVSPQTNTPASQNLTLQCGKANLNIPVGTDVHWLGSLLNELSS